MPDDDQNNSGDQFIRMEFASTEDIAKLPPVPDAPPTVALTAGEGMPEVRGKLVFADWDYLNPDASLEDSAAIGWPDPVHRRGRTVFEFQTAAQPFWVEAYLYTAIDPKSGDPIDPATGHAADKPEYEFRYMNGSASEDSIVVGSDSVTVDALPADVRPKEYVAVFAARSIPNVNPEFDPETDEFFGYVNATWRFHFAND